MAGSAPVGLTPFQVEVVRLFFELPASAGFLLAGGAALVAQHLTDRPTQDLDFFTQVGGSAVADARDQFEAAAAARGWTVERVRDEDTFCRLVVSGPEDLLVDLAFDAPRSWPAATCSPSSIARRRATSRTCTSSSSAPARSYCSPAPPRSMQASIRPWHDGPPWWRSR